MLVVTLGREKQEKGGLEGSSRDLGYNSDEKTDLYKKKNQRDLKSGSSLREVKEEEISKKATK